MILDLNIIQIALNFGFYILRITIANQHHTFVNPRGFFN